MPPQKTTEPRTATPETLEGTIERVVFESSDSGWTVLRLRAEQRPWPVTAVGRLAGLQPGERVRLSGAWEKDRKYGEQFRVASYLSLLPETALGIERYLGSGLVPGVGKVMARRLVERFGLRTLEVIENEPEKLAQVGGIGPVRSESIRRAWREQRALRDVMIFLQTHGLSASWAARIFKAWGPEAPALVRRDPFRLADQIPGIGFATADRIAGSLGIPADAPERARAGVLFALGQAAEQGHLFLPRPELERRAGELLELPEDGVRQAVDRLVESDAARRESRAPAPDAIYLPRLHQAEHGAAERIRRLLAGPSRPLAADAGRVLAAIERGEGIRFAPAQRRAIEDALSARLQVITGGPGTGKTTLVRAVVQTFTRARQRVLLCAPTGRAAKRLGEATGAEARTIHRLLEYDPRRGGFQRTAARPLEADLVIVDEASMLDAVLAFDLLEAVPPDARLILVGDVDQLAPVGPGKVLEEIIRSRQVPVTRLTRIFRQAEQSGIVRNAHRIHRGEMPRLEARSPRSDFFFIERREPEEVLSTLLQLVTERVPRGFGLRPREDVQVLTPMRRGLLGADNLNRELQAALNPGGRAVAEAGRLRIGDRVMQTRNNYDLEVFNGDIGRVLGTGDDGSRLRVTFDDRAVEYDPAAREELTLAYACSVHKAQGSEYPCVVMPLHGQHWAMLQRNLLYTAVTRARRVMVLVGDRRALGRAVRNDRPQERYTRLAELLAAPGPER